MKVDEDWGYRAPKWQKSTLNISYIFFHMIACYISSLLKSSLAIFCEEQNEH